MCCLQLQRAVCTPETLRARSLEPPSPPNPNPSSLTNTLSVEALGTLSGGAVLAVDVAGATTGGVASTTAALGGSAGDGLGGSSSSGGGSGGNGLGGGRRGALAVVCESVSFEFLFGIPAGAPGYAKSRSARSSQVAQHASLTLCRKKRSATKLHRGVPGLRTTEELEGVLGDHGHCGRLLSLELEVGKESVKRFDEGEDKDKRESESNVSVVQEKKKK